MANSKYQYVKDFEIEKVLLKNTHIVLRIDGKGFSKFTDAHNFIKPNDGRGVGLMNTAAKAVMNSFTDIVIAYGQSDEYSFVFRKSSNTYNRREDKILTTSVSLFTSAYIFNWSKFFPDVELQYPPSFDARIVLYPSLQNLKDYISWRQVDCHINNLYNTVFWCLVHNSKEEDQNTKLSEAHKTLKGTFSKDKHEILFQHGINYNDIEDIWKKGSILIREWNATQLRKRKKKSAIKAKQADCNEEKKEIEKTEDLKEQRLGRERILEVLDEAKKESIILVHEDMVDKEEFYETHDLVEKLE